MLLWNWLYYIKQIHCINSWYLTYIIIVIISINIISFIILSIHYCFFLFAYLSIQVSIYLKQLSPTQPLLYPSIHPPTYLPTHLSIHIPNHLLTYLSTYTHSHLPTYPSTHMPNHLLTYLSTYPTTQPPLSTHLRYDTHECIPILLIHHSSKHRPILYVYMCLCMFV